MAEGWGRKLKGDKFTFFSAGTKKHGMNPHAVMVMKESGVDISHHSSKTTADLPNIKMDYVFTVCSDAHENCPFFPGGKIIHVGFDDPPRLAKDLNNEDDKLNVYRRVRDEIKEFVSNLEEYMEKEYE
jgi:arsenate reductase